MPDFIIPFVHYTPNLGAALTIALIALVTMSEHIGDHTALGRIIGKDLLHDPGLDRTLLGDGIATAVAGLLGGAAVTLATGNMLVTFSGMSLAAIAGVLLNLLLPSAKSTN